VGTNSVLLLIAQGSAGQPQSLAPLHEASTITRLGQGVDQQRRLHPDAVQRTLLCMKQYAELIRRFDVQRVDVVSTSATRDAQGTQEFLDGAEGILGTRPRVISGEEEARLTFLGALTGLPVQGNVAVYDIGGGSTEIVLGHRDGDMLPVVEQATSLDMGCVRLTERHISQDPPVASEIDAVRASIDAKLAELPVPSESFAWVGIGGTITTLVAVELGLERYDGARVHGSRLTRATVEGLVDRLGAMPLGQRRMVAGLEPKRADVIVAGACLVGRLLSWAKRGETHVSDRGVRWGLAFELCGPRDQGEVWS
jgi:exopolyphosphatase/guanosine-5'-triphosphate,3'-diphosphate pyrophosphatase